jgi:hypothetical protein
MENTETFELSFNVKDCTERSAEGGLVRGSGAEALETFSNVLRAYGMDVSTECSASGKRATIRIWHPEPLEAERLKNRNGGRYRMRKPMDSPALGLEGRDLLEWLKEHTTQEGMKALGCSRRTYFRRIKELRERYGK